MSAVVIDEVERDVVLALRARVLSEGRTHRSAHLRRDLVPTSRHWAAMLDDAVVGCVSVMVMRGWVLRGMAVAPEHQRMGIGAKMLARVHADVGEAMWCNARIEAVAFYASQGWIAEGPVFDIDHEGPHQRMTWAGASESI